MNLLTTDSGRGRGLRLKSLLVTCGLQASGAPVIDQAHIVDDEGRRYGGWAIRPRRGPGLALMIGWRGRVMSTRPRQNVLTMPRP